MIMIVGTAQLRGAYGALGQSVEQSGDTPVEFLCAAQRLGFNAIDTAAVYLGAEEAIGTSPVSLDIHTKLDPTLTPEESIEGSLHRLGRRFVEVAYLHQPDATVVDGGVEVDSAARLLGVSVGLLGASVYSVDALRAALAHEKIGVVQIPVNPLNREVVDAALRSDANGTQVFGRSLLAQGLLAAGADEIPARLGHLVPSISQFQRVCHNINRSPVEAALLWTRDHPALSGVVVGAASIAQLTALSSVLSLPGLSAEERTAIDAVPVPDARDFDPRTWK